MTTTNMNTNSQPVLLYLEEIEPFTWALRYSCKDTNQFYEIRDYILSFPKKDRRWDPTLYNGKGAWRLDEDIIRWLDGLFFDDLYGKQVTR